MQIWESLEAHIAELLPEGWKASIGSDSRIPPIIHISHEGRNLRPPLTLMLVDDEVAMYADKEHSHGLYNTYGYLGRFFLSDPTSIDDITGLIRLRLLDYV
jgi:hypothetical protein